MSWETFCQVLGLMTWAALLVGTVGNGWIRERKK